MRLARARRRLRRDAAGGGIPTPARFLFGRWVNIDLEMRRVDWTLRHLTVARQRRPRRAATLLGDVAATLGGGVPARPAVAFAVAFDLLITRTDSQTSNEEEGRLTG